MISKDGHSWFFENLSELGIIGAGLMVAFVAVFMVISVKDLRRIKKGRYREIYGAFFAASLMLLAHAMLDWDWEMPVIFLSSLMFAGGLLRYGQLSREAGGEVETVSSENAGSRKGKSKGSWNRTEL